MASGCATGDEAYLKRCCDKLETDARTAIEAAQDRTAPSAEAVDITRAQEEQARAKSQDIRQRQIAIFEERADIKRQREGLHFWEKKRLGEVLDTRLRELAAEEKQLNGDAKLAQHTLFSAMAAHANAEKAHFAAIGDTARESAEITIKQHKVLETVQMVRQLFRFWPDISRLGPSACYKIGEHMVRKKSQLMDINAKNIWGIPLAWDP